MSQPSPAPTALSAGGAEQQRLELEAARPQLHVVSKPEVDWFVKGEHGEGPSRSQVIMGSAQRGFASRGYRDVYTDYSGHAEEVLERDEVPPGYRFYVRRYFQLIRPRD